MWEYVFAVAGTVIGNEPLARALCESQPGAVIPVNRLNAVVRLPRPAPASDCVGCGAPLKAYIHHCEYCRRAK